MGLLDNILEMRSQGLSDEEIIENLRQQGFSPREINEAYSQLQVREAVSQEIPAPEPGAAGYGQEYANQQYNQGTVGVSSEMVADIVEQQVAERISSLNKNVASLGSLRNDVEAKLGQMDSRIKDLEESMEKLQHAIIGKIGEYGRDIKSIHNEMGMMQESFGKVLNPLIDKTRRVEKEGGKREDDSGSEGDKEDAGGIGLEGGKDVEGDSVKREHFNFDLLKKIGNE